MVEYFAATDTEGGITSYLFTQGVLGVACLCLGIVVVYQQRKLDKRDEKIQALQDQRLDDNKTHAADYRELAKDNQEVMSNTSQNVRILSEKIEVGKARGR